MTSEPTPIAIGHDPITGAERCREVHRITIIGLAANLMLSALKFVVGILASSQALVADAVHSLSDSTTDLAVIIGAHFWTAPADEDHPYGHGRIETVISLLIGAVLALVGLWLAISALKGIGNPHPSAPGWGAFIVACASILSKESLYRWTIRVGKRVRSKALIANAWHHRSDGFSSIPVAIAVLGVRIWPSLTYLDHVAALLVSALVVQAACKITLPALRELVDIGPTSQKRDELTRIALADPRVRQVHAVRTRQIGPEILVDLHLLVDPDISVREGHAIAHQVKDRFLQEDPEVVDVLIHVEPCPVSETTPNA